ncbi:hypothetical protein GGE45_005444 [Rhizobium aethiopicum]|uniref:Uncharacterized protein n=1 Tax=Rhizobium aethiopicum TaxID=1138170 RepID=A0A7W6QC90_9HYPH|nr:hypothetical protein [Rhizobium aethiopicum]MBB4194888.1 hypothetical protein [Rhizobium aethiopicum]MBB4583080.1 hypothetical protein [Rhizobium aethiopicum]
MATAIAGFMALLAAKWTVTATRSAAAQNEALLKEQIAIQRDELAAIAGDQRPWIKVSMTVEGTTVDDGDGIRSILLKTTMANLGNRPATRAMCHLTRDQPTSAAVQQIMDAQKNFDNPSHASFGYTIFPGETYTESGTYPVMYRPNAGGLASVHFGGVAAYKSAHSDHWLFTPFSYVLSFTEEQVGAVSTYDMAQNIDNVSPPL